MLTIDLVAHFNAVDRNTWTGDRNLRPLTDLGLRQAGMFRDMLSSSPLDALYASPALRCVQSLEPLAKRFALEIEIHEGLAEGGGFPPPAGLEEHTPSAAYGGALVAGRAWRAIEDISLAHNQGHVVVCSHGDTLPALLAFLAGSYGLGDKVRRPAASPGWHRLHISPGAVDVEYQEPPPAFATA